MESKKISENVSEMTDNIMDYVHLKLNLLSLSLTEMLSHLASSMMILLIAFFTFLFFSLFASVAFILWYRDMGGHVSTGALIVALFYLVMGFVIILLRNPLIINPLVSQLSKMLTEDRDDNEE